MDITSVLKDLDAAASTDAPTTTKKAGGLPAELAARLTELRDWANELTEMLDNVEQQGDALTEAERDDLDDAHANWAAAVTEVYGHLAGLVA